MKTLMNRRVIITGAGSGIGAATAIEFARAGSRLVLSDINTKLLDETIDLCKKHTNNVQFLVGDIGEPETSKSIVDLCLAAYGGVDVLVNNAGMLTQAPVVDLTLDMWNQMLRVDLTSVFLLTQKVLPYMLAQRWGRIINVASQLGIKGGAELAHYSAAKAGVIAFSKSLALEVSKDNVLVNCVAPGPITTSLVDGISEEWKIKKSKELPLGRFGVAEEIAPVIAFLATEPGGNLFVGQTLGPNSGDVMQ